MCSFNFNIASLAEKPCKDHLHLNDLHLHHHYECSSVLLLGTYAILGSISVILLHFYSGVLTFLPSLPKYECVVVRDPEEKCSLGHQQMRSSRRGSQSPSWLCWVHRFWAELWARLTAVSLCSGYGSCTCSASFSWNIGSCSVQLSVEYKSALLV